MSPSKVTVQVVSDTVCPFCMLGKRRLETAIRMLHGQREVEVQWHPFQLNPNAPQEGINKLAYYKAKFGPERTAQMIPSMTEAFAEEGLDYNMEGLTGNTFNSHRLIAHAGQQGPEVQNRVVEELFNAYFTQGKYINDPEVLKEAARAAGVADGDRVVEDTSVAADQVREELRELPDGITGVPFFIFNGKTAVSGAQDPAVLRQALLAS